MCLAKAYFKDGDDGELLLENVASLEVKEDSLVLTTIMKETREVEGRLSSVNFRNGSIVLERTG
ncbi:MAG: CooT family nickel-binding protein [Deltaproteobacteria bacterium]|jgi:predicted RNA-binding protein|nr:CooT family nickel-binding protein [Deltaproteobacteria bacterium]